MQVVIKEQKKQCQRCGNIVMARLVRKISASGVSMIYWYCKNCRAAIDIPTKWLSHEIVKQYFDIESLPVVSNFSAVEKCVVCGSECGTEYHHWAPRYLFGSEAEDWPGNYLCKTCHTKWHSLVTPNMCKKGLS